MNKQAAIPTPAELAIVFAHRIREELTAEELAQVIADNNGKYKGTNVCATHDVIDPNQVMIDALEELGQEYQPVNDEDTDDQERARDAQTDLIFEAWGLAKTADFSFPQNDSSESTASQQTKPIVLCAGLRGAAEMLMESHAMTAAGFVDHGAREIERLTIQLALVCKELQKVETQLMMPYQISADMQCTMLKSVKDTLSKVLL